MNKISSITNSLVNRTSSASNITSGSFNKAEKVFIRESFTIPWQKIKLGTASAAKQLPLENELVQILIKVFIAVLKFDAIIVPTPTRKKNAVLMEASFSPPQHSHDLARLLLPLPGVSEELKSAKHGLNLFAVEHVVQNYVKSFLPYLNEQEIIKLIIISSHEFGHLQSYRQGEHSPALAIGIRHFALGNSSPSIIENFTWLVFKEEFQAWYYAARLLKPMKFKHDEAFAKVKSISLATYIQELKLEKANLKTCYRLASFGHDFTSNFRSKIFVQR